LAKHSNCVCAQNRTQITHHVVLVDVKEGKCYFFVQALVNENMARRRKKKLEQRGEENQMKGCAKRNANKRKL